MAIKIQYNKTAIQQYQKQLSIREKALPTLKNKETALRVEVKRIGDSLMQMKEMLDKIYTDSAEMDRFWVEFPDVVSIENTEMKIRNIAGVKIPILKNITFSISPYSLFQQPAWVPAGIEKLKEIIGLKVAITTVQKQFELLNYARKKTTQKVNLYEKVQIPEYQNAIRKTKRFLEDKENLEKSAQKIVKERNQAKEAAL
jgi:V/A-type H+/Na+-transporting ATPase subunit D